MTLNLVHCLLPCTSLCHGCISGEHTPAYICHPAIWIRICLQGTYSKAFCIVNKTTVYSYFITAAIFSLYPEITSLLCFWANGYGQRACDSAYLQAPTAVRTGAGPGCFALSSWSKWVTAFQLELRSSTFLCNRKTHVIYLINTLKIT